MATSLAIPQITERVNARTSARTFGFARFAGLAGLLFVFVVIGQNMVRMGIAPANDSSVESIITHYQADRALFIALGASFAVSGAAIAFFIGGVVAKARRDADRFWSAAAVVGGAAMMACFAAVVATESALLVATDKPAPTPAVVETLWILHNGLFGVLNAMLAVALVGVSRVAAGTQLIPAWMGRIAPVGAGLLLIGTVAGPLLAAGEMKPLMGLAGLGFLTWLAVTATASFGLLRSTETAQ